MEMRFRRWEAGQVMTHTDSDTTSVGKELQRPQPRACMSMMFRPFFERSIAYDSSACVPALVEPVRRHLSEDNACLVRGFPAVPEIYLGLLQYIGRPLPNYGQGKDLAAYALHPLINRVRYEERASEDKYLHEKGDPLLPHSARSWRDPRPRYFAMLMTDPGWIDEGNEGTSLFVRWSEALHRARLTDPTRLARILDVIRNTRVKFTADHVRERTSSWPIVYALPDSRFALDLGCRIRGRYEDTARVVDVLDTCVSHSRYLDALREFFRAVQSQEVTRKHRARAGDLMIIDNNRIGHGRTAVPTVRGTGVRRKFNPRELWSCALD